MSVSRVIITLIFAFVLTHRATAYTSFFQVVATNIQNTLIRVTVTEERGQKHFQVCVILDSWNVGGTTNAAFKGWLDGQWLTPRLLHDGQRPSKAASKPNRQALFDFVVPSARLAQRRFMVCVYGRSYGEPEEMRIPYMVWWFYLNDLSGGE
jgi:hypothetical protein